MTRLVTGMMAYPSNDHDTPGYLARPDDDTRYPAVVVLQEWWGLVPHIKDVADRLARQGYIALAPDLYHGKEAKEPDEARKLRMALDRDRAVAEIQAAARYLQQLDRVAPKKVGIIGWCMGGGLALSTAAQDGEIGAVIAFYGSPLSEEDTAHIRAPVLGLYGTEDHGIPLEAVREFRQALQEHNVPHEIHIYPGAQHAFFNDTRPEVYEAEAAQDAWRRALGWLGEHLAEKG